jgi:hypothetical protein
MQTIHGYFDGRHMTAEIPDDVRDIRGLLCRCSHPAVAPKWKRA